MSRRHVRPGGSVGRCDVEEGGRCKFAREGALHFESASEAQEYAAELLAHRSGGFTQGGAGYESLLLAVRAVRRGNMIPDVRRYVVTHPVLWDEALSGPEFYGWSSDDVRDVFEVSREVGLSGVEKRQRVIGRFAGRGLPKWGLFVRC